MMVTQIEDAKGYKKRIGFEHIIETALGMQNVSEIAAASKRNESLHFGVADYAASTRARTTIIGGVNPDYSVLTDPLADGSRAVHWGDMWHYALARMVVAARANGLRPVDGPFGDFSDPDGYRAAAKRAAVLGCEGKWAIHPKQVAALAHSALLVTDAVRGPERDDLRVADRFGGQGGGAERVLVVGDVELVVVVAVLRGTGAADRDEAGVVLVEADAGVEARDAFRAAVDGQGIGAGCSSAQQVRTASYPAR